MDNRVITLKALKNYYQTLRKTGYVPKSDVYALMVLSFITDLCSQEYAWYISQEDYKYLINLLQCLGKQYCLVPFDWESIKTDPVNNYLENIPIKITEDEVIRLGQEIVLKLQNK